MVSTELSQLRKNISAIRISKDYKGFEDADLSEYEGMSEAEIKKKDIDFLLQIQNNIANQVLQDIRKANFETIQRDVFGYTEYEENKPVKEKKSKGNFVLKSLR